MSHENLKNNITKKILKKQNSTVKFRTFLVRIVCFEGEDRECISGFICRFFWHNRMGLSSVKISGEGTASEKQKFVYYRVSHSELCKVCNSALVRVKKYRP